MRTPAQIARGWRDARFVAPTPVPAVTGPGFVPRLRVHRSRSIRRDGTARWLWEVWEGCVCHAWGDAATHGEALAVGLAALESASVRSASPRPGLADTQGRW